MTKPILLIAGEGGHLEQARRFYEINNKLDNTKFIIVTDEQLKNISIGCEVTRMKNISRFTKQRSLINLLIFIFFFVVEFIKTLFFILKVRPSGVVAFGPIFCLPYITWARILGLKTVYIETWSKFYEPSITATICQKIVHRIYIQNITLKEKLREGIYSGKL
mgnify:CR=1 FL=1